MLLKYFRRPMATLVKSESATVLNTVVEDKKGYYE